MDQGRSRNAYVWAYVEESVGGSMMKVCSDLLDGKRNMEDGAAVSSAAAEKDLKPASEWEAPFILGLRRQSRNYPPHHLAEAC
jgi:hypothetical protein